MRIFLFQIVSKRASFPNDIMSRKTIFFFFFVEDKATAISTTITSAFAAIGGKWFRPSGSGGK